MTKYIEHEALRDALYDADAITFKGLAILNNFPAADVAPVVHGRWIFEHNVTPLGDLDLFHCSECGDIVGPFDVFNYCPNCGAKMDNMGMDCTV